MSTQRCEYPKIIVVDGLIVRTKREYAWWEKFQKNALVDCKQNAEEIIGDKKPFYIDIEKNGINKALKKIRDREASKQKRLETIRANEQQRQQEVEKKIGILNVKFAEYEKKPERAK